MPGFAAAPREQPETALIYRYASGDSRQRVMWETIRNRQATMNHEPSTLLPLADVRSTGSPQASGSAVVTY
ncbi:hypothetical protein FHS90_001713 [Rufibacter quisquiliarum]|uniref:Uncharacterized protein n=1 Tax=Rufibacter quisquiliarum TaxID=1549639 RepID=A0A839GN79_9BACT|nr:hypothetical protein [Rufibacter quisquiliarum]